VRLQSREAQIIAQKALARQAQQLNHKQAQPARAVGGAHAREVTDAPHGFNIINGVPLTNSGVTDFVPFPSRENVNPEHDTRTNYRGSNMSGWGSQNAPAYEELSMSKRGGTWTSESGSGLVEYKPREKTMKRMISHMVSSGNILSHDTAG
jgi:hypothetical protein